MGHAEQTGGYTRHIDELGRVVLPLELRKKLDWQFKDAVSLTCADDNTVIMQLSIKYSGPRCVFCSATEAARTINGKDICKSCLESIVK